MTRDIDWKFARNLLIHPMIRTASIKLLLLVTSITGSGLSAKVTCETTSSMLVDSDSGRLPISGCSQDCTSLISFFESPIACFEFLMIGLQNSLNLSSKPSRGNTLFTNPIFIKATQLEENYNITVFANDSYGQDSNASANFTVGDINDVPSRPFISSPNEDDYVSGVYTIQWSAVNDEISQFAA